MIVAAEPQIPPNAQSTELASEAEPSEEASALPRGGGGSDPHIDRVFHAAQGGGAGVLGALVVHARVQDVVEDERRVGGRLDAQVEPREGGVAAVLLRTAPRRLRESSEKALRRL